jgi:tRNA threonylcarbamoyladenosine biosynthesis protein TsaE
MDTEPMVHVTDSESETAGVARMFAARLRPGTVVLLYGGLGAGKTAFVRGLAEGLGLDPADVSSPTFTLVQEYRGDRPLIHVDLYRLDSREVDDLGLEDLGVEDAVVAIEWADRLPRAIPDAVEVRIEDAGGDNRRIVIG